VVGLVGKSRNYGRYQREEVNRTEDGYCAEKLVRRGNEGAVISYGQPP